MMIKYNCDNCSKEYELKNSEFKKYKVHFCSIKCKGDYQRKALIGSNNPNYRNANIEYECDNCKKKCNINRFHYSNFKNHFCSVKCRDEHRKKYGLTAGKNNPNWQDGKSFEPYNKDWTEKLKTEVRKRDNNVCKECGCTKEELGYNLHVHHIDYNKQNNVIDNLISLCNSCHTQTNFGRKDWTNYFNNKLQVIN